MALATFRFARILVGAITVLTILSAVPRSHAAVLYTTSFESPTFTAGPISGQDGWSVFGPGISSVNASFAKTGTQSVFVDGGTASQSGPYHTNSSTGPLIDLSADIAIFTSSTQTGWQFAALGPSLIGFLGGIDVRAAGSSSNIVALTSGFPVIGTFARATAFDATAWHHIDLLFNMTSQTYNITLDNSVLASNVPFCGDNTVCAGAVLSTYANGFFDSFGSVPGSNDSGYMDNFLVQTVPEPSSILLIGAGLVAVACGARRRMRRAA